MARDPGRTRLEQVIRETGGNITRMAGILNASRRSVYNWVYRHGLDALVGINAGGDAYEHPAVHSVHSVHSGDNGDGCEPPPNASAVKKTVNFPGDLSHTLGGMVEPAAGTVPDHVRLPRSTRLSEGIWRWAQHVAVDRRCSASEVVELALQRLREDFEEPKRTNGGGANGSGEDGQ